jgi:hypothetical protein|tara:strand:- start:1038 stop:1247 length:210 start_codon:yes stop_codon:yes gene_type:complete
VQQDPKCSEKTDRAKRISALINRGAAVLKKALKLKEETVVKQKAPKKMRKISLDAAFEKEKKSQGKRKK